MQCPYDKVCSFTYVGNSGPFTGCLWSHYKKFEICTTIEVRDKAVCTHRHGKFISNKEKLNKLFNGE